MDAMTPEPLERLSRPKASGRRWPMAILCLLVIAAIIGVVRFWPAAKEADPKKGRDANRPIPVLVATVERKDMPILLDGLGTVQAYNAVTIKPMIDGPLVAVNFAEGQMVAKGDVLAQIDSRAYQAALDQVSAKKAQDEALLANARLDLERYRKLVASNFTPAQQADTAKALVAQYEALVRQDQAQIDTAKTNLSYTTIVAPIAGRTGVRLVDQGNIIHSSDPTGLVTIAQLQPVSVVFTLPQQSLPVVAKAMSEGKPRVLATPQGGRRSAVLDAGVLAVLDNQVDPTTGTIKLKATFPNTASLLWPGGFVGVRVQVETAKDAVVIPPAAMQRGPRGAFVFVVADDNSVSRQIIKTGYEDEQATIVLDGLKGGEKVVTDGASRLNDTSTVTISQPSSDPQATRRPRPDTPGAPRRRPGGAAE